MLSGDFMSEKKNDEEKKNGKNKKLVLIIAAAVFFVAGIVSGFLIASKNRSYKIAFYDLPNEITKNLQAYAEKSGGKFSFSFFDGESGFSVEESKKYAAVFTWDGAFAKSMAKSAKDLPTSLFSQMPSSLRRSATVDEKLRLLPVLYDHVPVYFLKDENDVQSAFSGPETLALLEEKLGGAKADFSFASITAGSDDECFYEVLSMFAESVLGADGYKNLAEKILEKKSFREVLDETVGKNSAGENLSLRTVMDKIFDWQSRSLIQRQWYMINEDDLMALMQQKAFYMGFMPLKKYRNMSRRISYNYSTWKFPPDDVKIDHGVVANGIVMISHSSKKPVMNLAEYLVANGIQEQLSNLTTYTAVHSQSGCYDSIADDARFFAASTKCGPLPQLNRAAFTSADISKTFAADAREFLILGQ